jgi:opacity protein-like surface antigen
MTKPLGLRLCWSVLVGLLMGVVAPPSAHAQTFVGPLLGYDYGGDSSCLNIKGCEDKGRNLGVSIGSIGSVFGSEFEIASAKNFFRRVPGTSSSVRTMMTNILLAPQFGPVRPYALIGVGRFSARIEDLLTAQERTDTHFGWSLGGGLMFFPTRHVGVRGDVRYFHGFQDLELDGVILEDSKLDFGRAAAGVVFRF